MKRIFIIVRVTRWEKRIILAFENQDAAIQERKWLMDLYPSANYLIEDCEFKEIQQEQEK